MILASAFLAFSANIDTLILSISYGLSITKISLFNKILIAIITSIGTYFSIVIGEVIDKYLPTNFSNIIGGTILILFGISIIYQAFIDTEKIETNTLTTSKSIILALTLGINNIGVGIAAGICDINAIITTIFNFIFTIVIIDLGLFIGKNIILKTPSKYFEILSGVFVILIGIYGIVG